MPVEKASTVHTTLQAGNSDINLSQTGDTAADGTAFSIIAPAGKTFIGTVKVDAAAGAAGSQWALQVTADGTNWRTIIEAAAASALNVEDVTFTGKGIRLQNIGTAATGAVASTMTGAAIQLASG